MTLSGVEAVLHPPLLSHSAHTPTPVPQGTFPISSRSSQTFTIKQNNEVSLKVRQPLKLTGPSLPWLRGKALLKQPKLTHMLRCSWGPPTSS